MPQATVVAAELQLQLIIKVHINNHGDVISFTKEVRSINKSSDSSETGDFTDWLRLTRFYEVNQIYQL